MKQSTKKIDFMKECIKCHRILSEEHFYKSRMTSNMCKDCKRQNALAYYKAKRRERIEYMEKYNAKYLQSEKGKEQKKRTRNRMIQKYPEKEKARIALRNAVATGKVKRLNCVICDEIKTHAHHEDYSKPLQVVWLCSRHHKMMHGVIKPYLDKTIEDFQPEWQCGYRRKVSHELGCPHQEWTSEQLKEALSIAKQSNAFLTYIAYFADHINKEGKQ